MMKSIRTYSFLLSLVFVLCGVECLAEQLSLKNGTTEAVFDERGLVEVLYAASAAKIELTQDAWTLTIDGRELRSTETTPAVSRAGVDSVIYRYQFGAIEIEAVYRLKPDWGFVSKELRVTRTSAKSFVVQAVVPWDVRVKGTVESEYTPSTYTPQFGATIAQSRADLPGKDYGAFLRFSEGYGSFFTVQNPYLNVAWSDGALRISYAPEMQWRQEWGTFVSDAACLGAYRLSGERLPREMVTEWHLPPAQIQADGMDRAEIDAFTSCVRAYLQHPAQQPTSVEVGWTLNDYQIDAGTEEGRAEYKRVIDTTADLGIKTLLYAPGNSAVSDRTMSADTWSWEYVLWLGMGEKIRKGEWSPDKDALPPSVTEMLAYAKQKHVGLLAYVYPSAPFSANPSWLVQRERDRETVPETGAAPVYATLASRELQDYLIRNLVTFQKRTGIAGYSFDYTWLNLPGSSSYAQWYGWRRVMKALREADPTIVIDGRQSYQLYGPWSWLAGSYPHPTGNDEQAESFKPFPDLHFDRVSANRTRFVNYWYRNYQFAPTEVVPGYAGHQTERSRSVSVPNGKPGDSEMMYTRFKPRDWDYLGYQYSFLSSIATGGWNNVVNMIPARDPEELRWFSAKDRAWIREWLEWTVKNRELLRHTRTIIDQPALGHVDGTSAIVDGRGFLFLFNPNYKRMPAKLRLDATIGLNSGTHVVLREVYPQGGRLIGKPGEGVWSHGDEVELELDGTSATVIEISPAHVAERAEVFNIAGAQASLVSSELKITHVAGEPGTAQSVGVLLPASAHVTHLTINGEENTFTQKGSYVEANVKFDGTRFRQAEQVDLKPTAGGVLTGEFVVPQRIFDEIEQRKKQWPIAWADEERESTWLVPGRLLLFVQLADGRDNADVTVRLDGEQLKLTPAYSSGRISPPCFVGFYADLSKIAPDHSHRIEVRTKGIAPGQLQGVFFDNVTPQTTEALTAREK
jgi:hypothetical protein